MPKPNLRKFRMERLRAFSEVTDIFSNPDEYVLLDCGATPFSQSAAADSSELLDIAVTDVHGKDSFLFDTQATECKANFEALLERVGDRTVVSYNAEFDRQKIEDYCQYHGGECPFDYWVCAMDLVKRCHASAFFDKLPKLRNSNSIRDCVALSNLLIELYSEGFTRKLTKGQWSSPVKPDVYRCTLDEDSLISSRDLAEYCRLSGEISSLKRQREELRDKILASVLDEDGKLKFHRFESNTHRLSAYQKPLVSLAVEQLDDVPNRYVTRVVDKDAVLLDYQTGKLPDGLFYIDTSTTLRKLN